MISRLLILLAAITFIPVNISCAGGGIKPEEPIQAKNLQVIQKYTRKVSAKYTCGKKKYCKQMTTCAEARFYLTQCGLTSLDRDKDGIPCESICR